MANNKLDLDSFEREDLKIEIRDYHDGGIVINFIGRIYMLNPTEVVDPFLDKLHRKILSMDLNKVTVNFEKLHLLNSSGLKTIIKWFKTNDSLGNKAYQINLIYDKEIEWQETSLSMLVELFPDTINKVSK